MKQVVFWDFHGTLTYDRYGWSGVMLHILETHLPEYTVPRETLSHLMGTGYPWHTPAQDHIQYNDDPAGWWRVSDQRMTQIYRAVGVPAAQAAGLAALFRETYLSCTENFIPYPDAGETLKKSKEQGYANVVLSNHIPELDQIIARLPFAPLLDHIITSGRVGYEKPHPAIYAYAEEQMGNPKICWMVGDNYTADCLGGLAAGFAPIWVHHGGHDPDDWDCRVRKAETLTDAVEIITKEACDGQE